MYGQAFQPSRILRVFFLTTFSLFFLSIVIAPTHRAQTVLSNSDAMSLDPNAPEVTLEGKRKQVFEDVLELFSSRPTAEIFRRSWRQDAIFEDPLSKCIGYKEYAPQWFGMPKVFPKSITLSKKEYTVRGLGAKKVMKSLVVIELDEQDKIIHLDDKWNGQEHPIKWGALGLRRLNAMTLPWLVSVPKIDKHE